MQRLSLLSLLLLSGALVHCSTTDDSTSTNATTGGAAGSAQAGTGGTSTTGGTGGTSTTGGTGGTTAGAGGLAAGAAGTAGTGGTTTAGTGGTTAAGAGGTTTAGSGGTTAAGAAGTTAAGSGGEAGAGGGGEAGAGGSGCGNGVPPAIDCQTEADLGKPCASGGTCLTTNCVGPDGKAVYYCSGDVVDNSAQTLATALGSTDGKCASCLNAMTGIEMGIDCSKAVAACDSDPAVSDSCADFIGGIDQSRTGDPSAAPNCWVENSLSQVPSEFGNNLAICTAKFCSAACGVTEGYVCNN